MKIKLYHVTQHQAYSILEQGSWFSFEPYGSNSMYYQGYDDGGKDYILPDGYTIGKTQDGETGVFCDGQYIHIGKHDDMPALEIWHMSGIEYIPLTPA